MYFVKSLTSDFGSCVANIANRLQVIFELHGMNCYLGFFQLISFQFHCVFSNY